MKVLLVTQYFYPENFKSNDIAFDLAKRGYQVDVLTGIPNYPKGKYYKNYGIFKKRVERINGVQIYRSFQFPRGNKSHLQLALNYFSFAFFGSIWGFILSLFKRYNCIIVHQTSPITQGFPAVVIKKIRKIPIYFWVLDVWPEALSSGGDIKNKHILSFSEKIVKLMYNNSNKILISSKEFTSSILKKGNYEKKIIYFPNWSIDFKQMSHNWSIPELPSGFIIMMAGNLGVSQDFESVIKFAIDLKESNHVRIVLIGEGSMKTWVDKKIIENNLQNTMFTFGQYPIEAMPTFYKAANAMLITLNGKYEDLSLYIPARLQSYMSAGRPILAMINGASNKLIKNANCGYAVNAGDYKALAKILKETILKDPINFENLGNNGRLFYESFFTKEICLDNLCKIINKNETISS